MRRKPDQKAPARGIFMTNKDIADRIAADAKKIVSLVFTAIAQGAAKGKEISLDGFGKFKVMNSPAR